MMRLLLAIAIVGMAMVPAVAEEAGVPCTGCGEVSSNATSGGDSRAGWICPLWEADYPESGFILYYCERYQTSNCSDTPTVCYWEGIHDWPCVNCVNCIGAYKAQDRGDRRKLSRKYAGFSGGPKPLNFSGPELNGPAGRFSQVLVNPKIPFIKRAGAAKHAKVFAVLLDVGMASGEPGGKSRTMYLAYEVDQAPPADATVVELNWDPIDENDSHAFSGTFTQPGKRAIPLLILTASNSKPMKK